MENVTPNAGLAGKALLVVDVQAGLVALIPAGERVAQNQNPPRKGAGFGKIRDLHSARRRREGPSARNSFRRLANSSLTQAGRWRARDSKAGIGFVLRNQLQEELERRGIKRLIIAGGMTEYCVDTTCRRATSLGYDVTRASDAHLTRDNGVLSAANIIAHHNLVPEDFGAGNHLVSFRPTREIAF
jgi:nicotinamidase-related amidase